MKLSPGYPERQCIGPNLIIESTKCWIRCIVDRMYSLPYCAWKFSSEKERRKQCDYNKFVGLRKLLTYLHHSEIIFSHPSNHQRTHAVSKLHELHHNSHTTFDNTWCQTTSNNAKQKHRNNIRRFVSRMLSNFAISTTTAISSSNVVLERHSKCWPTIQSRPIGCMACLLFQCQKIVSWILLMHHDRLYAMRPAVVNQRFHVQLHSD